MRVLASCGSFFFNISHFSRPLLVYDGKSLFHMEALSPIKVYNLLKPLLESNSKRTFQASLFLLPRGGWALFIEYYIYS